MSSSLNTFTIDTDGHITLDKDALLTSIVSCCLQLEMEVILEEIDLFSRIRRTSNPLGIRFEPILVLSKPLFELLRVERLLSLFLEELTDISRLHTINGLVVAIAEGIKFLTLTMIGSHLSLALQLAQCLKVNVMRMEGKGRDDVIRIRVAPGVAGRRIIDGQQLNGLHACSYCPVDHSAKITEIAHTIRMLASKRENRHHDSSCSPHLFLQSQ